MIRESEIETWLYENAVKHYARALGGLALLATRTAQTIRGELPPCCNGCGQSLAETVECKCFKEAP